MFKDEKWSRGGRHPISFSFTEKTNKQWNIESLAADVLLYSYDLLVSLINCWFSFQVQGGFIQADRLLGFLRRKPESTQVKELIKMLKKKKYCHVNVTDSVKLLLKLQIFGFDTTSSNIIVHWAFYKIQKVTWVKQDITAQTLQPGLQPQLPRIPQTASPWGQLTNSPVDGAKRLNDLLFRCGTSKPGAAGAPRQTGLRRSTGILLVSVGDTPRRADQTPSQGNESKLEPRLW